jgi:hypothetical protein
MMLADDKIICKQVILKYLRKIKKIRKYHFFQEIN